MSVGAIDVAMYKSRLYTWRRLWPRFSAQVLRNLGGNRPSRRDMYTKRTLCERIPAQARLVRALVYVRLGTGSFIKQL